MIDHNHPDRLVKALQENRIAKHEAMVEKVKMRTRESAKEFLQRLRAIGGDDEGLNETIDEMQRYIDENRKPHSGIEL